jgi:hypothetical protein
VKTALFALFVSAGVFMWPGTALAATLIVWNLSGASLDVSVDGTFQCTVDPRQACAVVDIPTGTHTFSTGMVRRYEEGAGKVPVDKPIEFRWASSSYKDCRFSTGLVPDDCVNWVKDSARLDPPGVSPKTVAYHH